jgi:hypothetical protein
MSRAEDRIDWGGGPSSLCFAPFAGENLSYQHKKTYLEIPTYVRSASVEIHSDFSS